MKKNKEYYENLFAHYPDLVTVVQFRQMLNGIGDNFARKLIREKRLGRAVQRTTPGRISKNWTAGSAPRSGSPC